MAFGAQQTIDDNTVERPSGAARLLDQYSIEITGADKAVQEACDSGLAPGTEVFVAFVPGESVTRVVDAARRASRAGLKPVPHGVARSFADRRALDRFLGLLAEAGASRALVLSGDRPAPDGPFDSALKALQTGLFKTHGYERLYFGVHPEGHPVVDATVMRQAMIDKLAHARSEEIEGALVSQFTLDAAPLLHCLRDLPQEARTAPFRLGVAGPVNSKTLLKYALYCGVGVSLKALGARGATMSQLVLQESPQALLDDLAFDLRGPDRPLANIEGVHFFTFGGVARTASWTRDLIAQPR